MTRDPYVVLGISSGASPAELKRAYRRLAMRWHPDRNDAPEATERFKEINAAYERLMASPQDAAETGADPEDAPSVDAAEEATEAADAGDARAADIRLNLELSLEEAAHACRKTLRYVRGKACPTCDGSGEAGMTRTRFCGACHGSGRVRGPARSLVACTDCAGRGFISERICPDCGGSGRETAEVGLDIVVPPGMLAGDELRLAGQGEPGDEAHAAGHLYLTVVLAMHRLYRLEGRDLHYRMPVGGLALIAGSEIELPTLNGLHRHRLEPGLPESREIRLAGLGYPGRGNKPVGDLVVRLDPVFPDALSARQRKLLEQAHADMVDQLPQSLPTVADWWRLYAQ